MLTTLPESVDVRLLHPSVAVDRRHALGEIRFNGQSFGVYFRASRGPISESVEPFVAAALLPPMRVGKPLRLDGPVSPRLLKSLQTIQDIYHS